MDSFTFGPRPHLRGYTSLLIITLLILAQNPWSQVTISAVDMIAIAEEKRGGRGDEEEEKRRRGEGGSG